MTKTGYPRILEKAVEEHLHALRHPMPRGFRIRRAVTTPQSCEVARGTPVAEGVTALRPPREDRAHAPGQSGARGGRVVPLAGSPTSSARSMVEATPT